jgi:thiosulfate dehydrogenase
MIKRIPLQSLTALLTMTLLSSCETTSKTGDDTARVAQAGAPKKVPFRVPQESEIKDSVTLASVRRGRALIHSTRDSLPNNTGASLTCSNCHVDDGTRPNAMPLVGSYARFPQYRARSARVDRIENRINDCFERSMNGKPLDWDGRDMRDMVAYLAFLSIGFPVGVEMEGYGMPAVEPMEADTTRGRAVFGANCVACHGQDGGGTAAGPPVWGPKSYNIGAGLARTSSAVRFIHKQMPRDRPGSLTPQQAWDVAKYINTRPRPDYAKKIYDFPKGGAPADVAYETIAARKAAKKSQ